MSAGLGIVPSVVDVVCLSIAFGENLFWASVMTQQAKRKSARGRGNKAGDISRVLGAILEGYPPKSVHRMVHIAQVTLQPNTTVAYGRILAERRCLCLSRS
jgi:hypothetical protein